MPRLVLLALLSVSLVGCSVDASSSPPSGPTTPVSPGDDGGTASDAGSVPPAADGGEVPRPPMADGGTAAPDGGAAPPAARVYDPPTNRGSVWVRANPMLISGLTPSLGAPPADFVRAYFDDFGANVIHLWQDGLPVEARGWDAMRPGAPYISWTLPDGRSQGHGAAVLGGAVPAASGRIAYQVSDEPRSMEDLLAIEEGVAAVRRADPDALIIINFGIVEDGREPGEGGVLDRMVQYTVDNELADILAHDNYSMRRGGYRWLEHFRRVGVDNGLPYYRYLNSYAGSGDRFPTESDTRWHAKIGVVYGFTGHSWFLYQIRNHGDLRTALFERTGDFSSARRPAFAWAATQNRELARLGPLLTQLTSTDVRYVAEVALGAPAGTRAFTPGAGGDPYLADVSASGGGFLQDVLVGFFRDDWDERYLIVQNPNHESGTFPTDSTSDARVTLGLDMSVAPEGTSRDHIERFDLGTGDITTEPIRGSAVTLTIPAGEIAVLKYATGRAWAGL